MVRAIGSYPIGRGFDPPSRYHLKVTTYIVVFLCYNLDGGYMKQIKLSYKVDNNYLLLNYLYKVVLNKSKNNIKSLLKNGNVLVNGNVTTKHDYEIKNNDIVDIDLLKVNSNIKILYEDRYFIAVDKPSGLLSIALDNDDEENMYHYVRDYLNKNNEKVFILHRLDKETSGLLLFAKNIKIRDIMQDNWDKYASVRRYIAIVEGIIDEQGVIKSYLKENKQHHVYSSNDGKLSITKYKRLRYNDRYSLVEIDLETGRKNQIRVHMSDINHKIVGDNKYNSLINPINRLALHACKLEFYHPILNKKIILKSEIPSSFIKLFDV